jgi:hypothetical protein
MSTPFNERPYGTAAELEFIDRLAASKHAVDKLRGNLAGMQRRREFGSIDASRCIGHAMQCLRTFETRIAQSRAAVSFPALRRTLETYRNGTLDSF